MKLGKVSENVLKRSVLQPIKTKRDEVMIGAGVGEDCAIFSFHRESEEASRAMKSVSAENVMISCTQEGIFASPGQVLQKCVNVMAARGAEPVAVSISLLLPVGAEEEELKTSMREAEDFCGQWRVQIAQAHARASESISRRYVTATMYGKISGESYHTVRAARPGQDIVVSKWIGLEGTAVLAKRHEKSLRERYPAWLTENAAAFDQYLSTVPEAAIAIKSGARAILNVSEGGIFAALWELAEGAGVGLTVDLKKLPIRQETVEVCDYCNANPYELLSGGCLLMTCEDGAALAEALEAADIPAVVVGKTTDSKDKLIHNEDEVRYLDRPHVDSVYGSAGVLKHA